MSTFIIVVLIVLLFPEIHIEWERRIHKYKFFMQGLLSAIVSENDTVCSLEWDDKEKKDE